MFSVIEMAKMMREGVSHTRSWNRYCSSWSSKKVPLFSCILYDIPTDDPADGLSELAAPGETR